MIFVVRKGIVKLIVIVFDRTSIPPKAYKEMVKTKKKDYCGSSDYDCDSDYVNYGDSGDCNSNSSESDESEEDEDEDETLQVLMSMTSGMLKDVRKGRSIY